MQIRGKYGSDDYKSQTISALRIERELKSPKKYRDILYVITFVPSVNSLLLSLEVGTSMVLDFLKLS